MIADCSIGGQMLQLAATQSCNPQSFNQQSALGFHAV
jgi:hypothetical protein